jgi:hypothetical protein
MNEAQARQWILDLFDLMRRLAALTPITIDESVAEACITAIKNDLLWQWIWRFIGPVINGGDGIIVTCDTTVAQEAEKVGLNPALLIQIIAAVIELIKMFRAE